MGGRLIYHTDDTDGSCIACNGSCIKDNEVEPHSWTASLVFEKDGKTQYGEWELCNEYALKVAEYVVGYTWNKLNHSCSLHVLANQQNISEEMVIYNGFHWQEVYPENDGPLYLARLEKDEASLDATCYYINIIKGQPNIATEMNAVLIALVVILMITWNGWIRYTKSSPPKSPPQSPSVKVINTIFDRIVYIEEPSNKLDSSIKK